MAAEHGRFLLAAAAGLVLAGCATAPPPPTLPPEPVARTSRPAPPPAPTTPGATLPGGPGNPPFYEVMGERYHVLPDSTGYTEQGVASWYGREFHGRRTSNGEIYDMYAMTAAHKTLPLPTTARVTNLTTGKSIVVRINDRGPFKKGRLIDLSYGAAVALGFVSAGTAMVEVEALDGPGGGTADTGSAAAVPRSMYAQVGAFSQRENAEQLRRRLEQQGVGNVVIRYDAGAGTAPYRVRVGPVADAAAYDAVVRSLAGLDVGVPRLVVESGDPAPERTSAGTTGLPGG